MANENSTTGVIDSFQLSVFPEDWVKKCWDEDFLDIPELPAQCEEYMAETQCLKDQLHTFQEVLSAWVDKSFQSEENEGFWSVIVTSDVPHKSLIAVLAYLISKGSKVSASYLERSTGILAASVYIKLFVLPGSAAFKVYNPELFLQSCRFLNCWNPENSVCATEKRKSSPTSSQASQPSQKRRRGRGKGKKDVEMDSEVVEGDDEEASDIAEESLTSTELRELRLLIKSLLMDVLLVCEKYSLRQSESTAVQLLSVLIDCAKMHHEEITEKMGHWSDAKCSMGLLAYKAIFLLCQPFHGHVSAMINQLFRRLVDHILMMKDGKVFTTLGRPVLLVRRQALELVRLISGNLGERCNVSLKTLIQHLSFRVPDRLEYRSHAAEAVYELLNCLPDLDYAKMLEWLKQLSKNQKISQRSFVVDLMALLLDKPERTLCGDVPTENAQFATHQSMVCVLLNRCSDSNAGVRSRALVNFSSCTKSKFSAVVDTIRGVITPITSDPQRKPRRFMPTPWVGGQQETNNSSTFAMESRNDNDSGTASHAKGSENGETEPVGGGTPSQAAGTTSVHTPVAGAVSFGNILLTPGFDPYLPDTEGVVSMIHRRVLDPKVVVRKCALQALQSFILFEAPNLKSEDLQVLQERCADPALSVRKQAVQSLSELLHSWPRHKEIQRAWLCGLLPRVMDAETTVQERCFDLLEEAILSKLKAYKPGSKLCDSDEWDLLNLITQESSEKLRRYLQKACQYWARNKKIKPASVSALQSHISGPHDKAAWMFLAELSKTPVKIDHHVVVKHWEDNASSLTGLSNDDCGKWTNVLSVLGTAAKSMKEEDLTDLQGDLQNRLSEFSYPPFVISGMISCISKLYGCIAIGTSKQHMQAWGEDLMTACVRYLSDVIFKAEDVTDSQVDEQQMIKYVFTLGEVCQRCPTKIPRKAVLLIQSIVAAPCISALSQADQATEPALSQKPSSLEHHESTESSESSSSQASSQAFTQTLSQFRGSKMSSVLRAHGFITLGKLCLVDEVLSKKIIAALARELEVCDSPAVRNNVVVIMGDLTVRYASVVDPYVTNVAACLKDPSALVRKNTLTILTRLLREEYVKWKGVLFFRYITTLLDEVQEIRTLAEFCLEHLLLKKHPNMFFNPFVDCIFHFNNYQDHPTYNKFKQSDKEKAKFSVEGKANASKRMKMYTFMLENMTDEQRFKVAAKLNQEILAAVVDKIIPLNKEGSALLQDTLAVLSCKEIKLTSLRGKGFGGQEEEVEGSVEAQAQAAVSAVAKKAFISQVVRRNVIENIVPVVVALKHMFEQARSSLLRDLMMYLRELLKDYKNEVKDILASDKQLAEEIYFDLRTFENQESQTETGQDPRQGQSQLSSTKNAGTPQHSTHQTLDRRGTPKASKENAENVVDSGGIPVVAGALSPARADNENVEASPRPQGDQGALSSTESTPAKHSEKSTPSSAIKEAAKRAMSRVEELRRQSANFSSKKKISSPLRPSTSDNRNNKRASLQEESQSKSLTEKDSLSRAISTPTAQLANITFGGEGNVTMLPPSPIPSMATAIARGGLCLSPTVRLEQRGNRTILHMPHPDLEDSKPQMWNVQSPMAKAAKETSADNTPGTPSRKSHAASRVGLRTRRARR